MPTLTTTSHLLPDSKSAPGWGWLVAFGVALVGCGVIALFNLPVATAASVYAIGVLMLFGAAIRSSHRSSRAAGAVRPGARQRAAVRRRGRPDDREPEVRGGGAHAPARVLAHLCRRDADLVERDAAARARPGRSPPRAWSSILAGMVFVAGWPSDAVYLLGMVLAFDLAFQGITAFALGLTLKSVAAA